MIELLTQSDNDDSLETVVIVGNGAIEGGNQVVWDAIDGLEQYDMHARIDRSYKISSPDVGVYLSTLSYIARDDRFTILRILKEKGELGIDRERFKFRVDSFDIFRNTLGQSFKMAQQEGRISLRDPSPVFKYVGPKKQFGVISINWDELLLNNQVFSRNLISLHGRASLPHSLILPMETTIDDRLFDLFLKADSEIGNYRDFDLVQKAFRLKEMRDAHDRIHMAALEWLINAKRVILWGVAFNGYDAELISLIPKDERDRELIIINPDCRARDISGTLLCNSASQRVDYDPVRCEEIVRKI